MDLQIPDVLSLKKEKWVTEEDTASRYGSGLIPVLATPAMIGLMESTAQEALQPWLPEGYITLGTEINVRHKKATPVGMKVECVATLTAHEGKRFTFSIEARDEEGEIGTATHTRHMVNAATFMEKLAAGRPG